MTPKLFPEIKHYIDKLMDEADQIPEPRKQLLRRLSNYLKGESTGIKKLNFICTHNSRRSHLAQVWATVAAAYYGLSDIETYSGGTEATAFNPKAVAALRRVGFQLSHSGTSNPHYFIKYAEDLPALECWSKTFDDPVNPDQDFAAIMTCSDADENCPYIPGVKLRLPLTYDDPKIADNTPEETDHYDERTRQIGREIFFTFKNSIGQT